MSKRRFVFFLLCLFCLAVSFTGAQEIPSSQAVRPEYKVGQKWSYRSRPGEESSYLIVVKIENEAKWGTIIHVALGGLKMKNPRSPNGFSESADHLPFSKDAIDKSAIKLLKDHVELPNFEPGYKLWRAAFDDKRAGVYTITVAEAVNIMELSLNQ